MYEESNTLCRLCLSEETLDGIFAEKSCNQWILDYLSIQINSNDQMSQVICAICHLRLAEFHEFRIRCLEVQEVLQTLSEESANQPKEEDLQESVEITSNQSTIEEMLEVYQIKSEEPSNQSLIEEVQEALQGKPEKPGNQSTLEKLQEVLQANYENPEKPNNQSTLEEMLEVLPAKHEKPINQTTEESKRSVSLECTKCSKVFTNRKQLYNHRQYHRLKHKDFSGQFQCDICQKIYGTRKQLLDHRRYHILKNHACIYCQKCFDRGARMRTHMKVCALRTKKKIKELEENAFNNEEYTWELLQIMEDEESSSSIEVLPHTAEADQNSESDESETYEIVVYTENFEEQETSETPKSAK
nr:zinc finger protein 646-like [Aedes albopictus]